MQSIDLTNDSTIIDLSDSYELPVDIMVKGITKHKLLKILMFLDSENLKHTEICSDVNFSEENQYYYQKYIRYYIQAYSVLPICMKPLIELEMIRIIQMKIDNENNELLKKSNLYEL